VNPESTGDCLEGVSGNFSGIGFTVLRDDLRPEELRCFSCFSGPFVFLGFSVGVFGIVFVYTT
jgi:hypothetical protein